MKRSAAGSESASGSGRIPTASNPYWAAVERGHRGVFHKMSGKRPQRQVDEFAGRHNARDMDTIDRMGGIASNMVGKRLTYARPTAPNGLDNGAWE